MEESVRLAKENCGFDLQCRSPIFCSNLPSSFEIGLLRSFDPEGYFLTQEVNRK
jgi:hypothetical protein